MCIEPTGSRTTARQGEVDFVFITLMLGAQMQLKLMDRVYLISNFRYEESNYIIIITCLYLYINNSNVLQFL